MDDFVGYPLRRARARARRHQVERAAAGRLPGRPAAGAAREPRRRACSTSPARRRTTSRCATARSQRGFKLNEYGLFRVDDDTRDRRRRRGRDLRGARPGAGSRRSCARTAARSRRPSAARCRGWSSAPTCAATCTCTPPRPTARTTSRRWRAAAHGRGPRVHRDHRSQPGAGDGQRPRRDARARARARASARSTRRLDGITLLAGIECDIRADGTMDLADDCLAAARHRRRLGAFGVQPGRQRR